MVLAEDPGQEVLVWRHSCTEGWGRCLQCASVRREKGDSVHSSALNEGNRSHLVFAPGPLTRLETEHGSFEAVTAQPRCWAEDWTELPLSPQAQDAPLLS